MTNWLYENIQEYLPESRQNNDFTIEEMTEDICSMADEFNAKHSKYKWHNLVENPDDLPEFYKKVEVVYWDKGTHEVDQDNRAFTRYGMKHPFTQIKEPIKMWIPPFQYFSYDHEIIAWRYIKPF